MSSVVVAMWILGFMTGVETVALVIVLAKLYDQQEQINGLRKKYGDRIPGPSFKTAPPPRMYKGPISPRMYKAPPLAQQLSDSQ